MIRKTFHYRCATIVAALLGGLLSFPSVARTEPPVTEKASAISAGEKPFWESAQGFVEAYARRDASAIGELFTEDAEFFDEFGERTDGREAIVEMFQDVFDATPDALIEEIVIDRVRHVTDTVALEEGHVVASETAEGPHYHSRYVALHVKGADGKWRINTLKDYPRNESVRQEQLAQVAWLTGEWVNQDSQSVVHTACDWSEDGNYLLRRFSLESYDGRELKGVQRIGWDAGLKRIRSWTFDSEGGFLNGLWTRRGDQWLVAVNGVTAEGETVSGTAVYTLVDAEMIRWQYRDLVVGDEIRDDAKPVTMVRRPPDPKQQGK